MSLSTLQKQRTIKQEFFLEGGGLHTGSRAKIVFKPAQENTGINFIRVDLPEKPVIKAEVSNVQAQQGLPRCTTIGFGGAVIHTVEHLMSVLCGLKITNLLVEIDAPEIPGLDGSGLDFLKAIKDSGIVEQEALVEAFTISEPIGVEQNGSSIFMVPAEDFRISYTLNYDHPFLHSQFFDRVIDEKIYENEIAPSRTFCLEAEAIHLKEKGLGKGANYTNTLVVGDKGVINNKVRFQDEFARHKVLDFIGDLYLLGVPVRGHVFAVRSGHTLNFQLLKRIFNQKKKIEEQASQAKYEIKGKNEIDINGIMKILPHRFPFLLVDRVLEIEKGKKAIGLKNVTGNENFFQGHFPTRPIMPGVLMVEAMAQTAGVVVLTSDAHHGKVAFFMAADNVKFRKVVEPGDQLVMEVEVIKEKSRYAQIHAQASVRGEVVAEADMIFSFTDKSYLDAA